VRKSAIADLRWPSLRSGIRVTVRDRCRDGGKRRYTHIPAAWTECFRLAAGDDRTPRDRPRCRLLLGFRAVGKLATVDAYSL